MTVKKEDEALRRKLKSVHDRKTESAQSQKMLKKDAQLAEIESLRRINRIKNQNRVVRTAAVVINRREIVRDQETNRRT